MSALLASALVLFTESSERRVIKQGQSLLACLDFCVTTGRRKALSDYDVVYNHCGEDGDWCSIFDGQFACFQAVVSASILVYESVVQVSLWQSINDSLVFNVCTFFQYAGRSGSHGWMLIRKSVVYQHIMEVWLNIFLEKALDHRVVKLGVNKYGSKIGFHHVGQALLPQSASM